MWEMLRPKEEEEREEERTRGMEDIEKLLEDRVETLLEKELEMLEMEMMRRGM